MLINEKVYDIEECVDIFKYLDTLDVEYRKPYSRFGKTVHVPRGQASFTLSPDIHYDYKVSGGSPPNIVMSDELKEITRRVNKVLGTNFNTILLNKYKDGNDCIGFHQDRENGWAPNSGFATLSFGAVALASDSICFWDLAFLGFCTSTTSSVGSVSSIISSIDLSIVAIVV